MRLFPEDKNYTDREFYRTFGPIKCDDITKHYFYMDRSYISYLDQKTQFRAIKGFSLGSYYIDYVGYLL